VEVSVSPQTLAALSRIALKFSTQLVFKLASDPPGAQSPPPPCKSASVMAATTLSLVPPFFNRHANRFLDAVIVDESAAQVLPTCPASAAAFRHFEGGGDDDFVVVDDEQPFDEGFVQNISPPPLLQAHFSRHGAPPVAAKDRPWAPPPDVLQRRVRVMVAFASLRFSVPGLRDNLEFVVENAQAEELTLRAVSAGLARVAFASAGAVRATFGGGGGGGRRVMLEVEQELGRGGDIPVVRVLLKTFVSRGAEEMRAKVAVLPVFVQVNKSFIDFLNAARKLSPDSAQGGDGDDGPIFREFLVFNSHVAQPCCSKVLN
jgi:hypothetical protein